MGGDDRTRGKAAGATSGVTAAIASDDPASRLAARSRHQVPFIPMRQHPQISLPRGDGIKDCGGTVEAQVTGDFAKPVARRRRDGITTGMGDCQQFLPGQTESDDLPPQARPVSGQDHCCFRPAAAAADQPHARGERAGCHAWWRQPGGQAVEVESASRMTRSRRSISRRRSSRLLFFISPSFIFLPASTHPGSSASGTLELMPTRAGRTIFRDATGMPLTE